MRVMESSLKDKRIRETINLFTSGETASCIKKVKELLSLYYPDDPFLFNLLGVAYAANGDFKAAISSYNEALKLNSNYFEVFNNMGVAYNDWNKPDLALSSLNKALKIKPQYAEAYNNIGNSYKKNYNLVSQ